MQTVITNFIFASISTTSEVKFDHMPEQQSIPVFIITGFLGSGKTSLLNRLVAAPEWSDSAIIINELGSIGLDHLLVTNIDDEVILLESGCVCCTVKDDLTATLMDLHEKVKCGLIPPFRRVVVETTGIADPAALHQVIINDPDSKPYYHFAKTITLVDGCYGLTNLESFPEAGSQVCLADELIISKSDLVGKGNLEIMNDHLRTLNPHAEIYTSSVDAHPDFSVIFSEENPGLEIAKKNGSPGKSMTHPPDHQHGQKFSTYTLRWKEPVAWEDFEAWLEGLLLSRGAQILRLKGLLSVTHQKLPIVIQGVQHSFYAPESLEKWPGIQPVTELVLITRNFSEVAARKSTEGILDVTFQD